MVDSGTWKRIGFGITAATFLFGGSYVVADTCHRYSNSRIIYVGMNAFCGETGSGCTECTNSGGDSCVTNGGSCTPIPAQKD